MRKLTKPLLVLGAAVGLSGVALAQSTAAGISARPWGIGGAYGLVNDVRFDFALDNFDPYELNGWVEYRFEDRATLRGTFGSMSAKGALSGATIGDPEDPVLMPDYQTRINYAMISVSYLFWEGFYTSGLFAGIGGYHFKPDSVASEYEPYLEPTETVFGWHAGVDGEFRLARSLGLVLRLTFHDISSNTDFVSEESGYRKRRQFLNADAGLIFRF